MTTRLTRAERKAQTRAQLCSAADRLFEQQGYAATTLAQIAEEAGLTKGAVYSNFASKEELFLEMLEHGEFLVSGDFSMFGDQSRTLAERFRTFGQVLARDDDVSLQRRATQLELRGVALRNPHARAAFAQMLRAFADQAGGALEDAVSQSKMQLRVPARAAVLIWSALAVELPNIRALLPEIITEEVFGEATRILACLFEDRDAQDGTAMPSSSSSGRL
jgi:AcrR family transcriptional regulator